MAVVLQYKNFNGEARIKSWNPGTYKFPALIKCYIQEPGAPKLTTLEKPSTRPASFYECCLYTEKIKEKYGDQLKQVIVWNVDALEQNSNGYKVGGCHES